MNTTARSTTFRRTSPVKWWGLPLYDICLPGEDAKSLEQVTAKGIVALGVSAKGIIAIGVLARGVFTFGVASFGAVSVGVCSIALLFAAGTIARLDVIAPSPAFRVETSGLADP